MSVEAAPAPLSPQEDTPYGTPLPFEQPYNAAEDPTLRNNPEIDVAIPLPEEFYTQPDYMESAPQTDEDFAARWGQIQGTWTKIKAGVYGATIGQVRALRRGERYDATKHNRVVQNEMYKNIGNLAVREHLFAHDTKRFESYADRKMTTVETAGAVLREVALMSAFVGTVAIRGAGRLLEQVAQPGTAPSALGVHMEQKAQKVLGQFDKIPVNPAAEERAYNVNLQLRRAQVQARKKAVKVS